MMTCRPQNPQSDLGFDLDLDLVAFELASAESLTYF